MSARRPPVTLLLPEGFSKGRPVDPGSYLLLVRNQNHGFRLLVVEIAKHSAAAWASIFATYCDDTGRRLSAYARNPRLQEKRQFFLARYGGSN